MVELPGGATVSPAGGAPFRLWVEAEPATAAGLMHRVRFVDARQEGSGVFSAAPAALVALKLWPVSVRLGE